MASRLKIFIMLLPKLPLVVRVTIMHILGLSTLSKYLDLRTNLIVSVLRSFLESARPRSVSQAQKLSMGKADVKGRIWVSLYSSPPPPETDIREALLDVIESMRDPLTRQARETDDDDAPSAMGVSVPELVPVEAEWTGYRAAVSSREGPPPAMSEADKYREMVRECSEPTTVLYFHGGAYYLMDPATHRPTTKKLAKLLGARCYSVRYRLAPKHPFPSALLDALVSYLTLLYPPPDAYHEAVKPEHIVFSGDSLLFPFFVLTMSFLDASAGGNLSLALLQTLLQLRRLGRHVDWYGQARQVPLPAGVTTISPWTDLTMSAPVWQGQGSHPFDYLPRPRHQGLNSLPPCDVWPANPRRENFYADDELMAHPLVSVIMNGSWEGSPPMYMCTGWEFLSWEDKALARKLAADGVPLVFEEYEAMSHCFALFLTKTRSSRRCFEGWTAFIRRAVGDPSSIEPSATMIRARTQKEVALRFESLLEDSHESVVARVAAKARSFDSASRLVAKL